MKTITIITALFVIGGCTGNDAGNQTTAENKNDTAEKVIVAGEDTGIIYDSNTKKIDTRNPATDTGEIVWVGIFARWNYRPGERYDGSYDTARSIFVMCAAEKGISVPREQVTFQEYGNCDTTSHKLVLIMKKVKGKDSFPIINRRPTVINNRVFYNIGNQTKAINLSPATIKRINKIKTVKATGTVPAVNLQHLQRVMPDSARERSRLRIKRAGVRKLKVDSLRQ